MNCRHRLLLGAVLLLVFHPLARGEDKDWVPLKLNLPQPLFAGTPKEAPQGVVVAPPSANPPVILIPRNARNLAPKAKISTSDKHATAAMLAKITDGDKEANENSIVLLRRGLQWVQFDLGRPEEIFAIAIWHAHDTPKIYRSVIVQAGDDEDFTRNVRTLFNNDTDNSSGLGAGTDRQYFETFQGKTIDAKGTRARYFRLYSHGSTESALNEYTEVEIYGRDPARAAPDPAASAAGAGLARARGKVPAFRKIQLTDKFWSEGASFGDFSRDGKMESGGAGAAPSGESFRRPP